jgi:putative acetyltransferase
MLFKEFLIRPCDNNDIPLIKRVVFTVLKEYNLNPDETGKDSDLNDVEKNYFSHNGFFGVAQEIGTNKIVGTFGLCAISNEICELRKMYLLKEARGKGLGDFILNTSISIARERGYKKIILETISSLKEAQSLYKKHGFKEIKPKKITERVDKAFELNITNKTTESE